MPKRLMNLRIDEVSSCDIGAGDGVKVTLLKRNNSSVDSTGREADALKALRLAVESIGDNPGKLVECFKQFHEFLASKEPKAMTDEEITKLVNEMVAKALADAAELNKDKGKTPDPKADDNADGDGDGDGDNTKKSVAKVAPDKVDVELAKRDAKIIDLSKVVTELRDAQAKEEFAKRAEKIGLTRAEGEHLRKAYSGDVTSLKFMEDMIAKLHTQVEKAGLFGEIGSAGGSPATPHDELMGKALELRKANPKLSEAQSYVQAMEIYPDIAKRERENAHSQIQKVAP
jgi:hypothetical protein